MGHNIPVFFLPINDDEVPETLDKWYSAENLLAEKWNNHEQNGLRMSTSRNWWHQHAIGLICEYLQIMGLEFLQREITCLNAQEIRAGISAIDKLLISCQHGIPLLAPEMEETGSIWGLRNDINGKFSSSQFEKAYTESQPVHEVKGMVDRGYYALVDFFSFIKSLKASLKECLEQNKKFFYVQPQP